MKRLALAVVLLASCHRKKPDPFVDVYLAADHACAKLASGGIVCWGGEYGDAPRLVAELETLPEHGGDVAKGRAHTCERLSNGTVACHGDNSFYQLADGTRDSRDQPKVVVGLVGVVQIVAAADGTCARLGDGDVRCWGNNTHGQLAPRMHPRVPVNVPTSVRH